jgi:periplasmic protein TonB
METGLLSVASLDDIVFEGRNKAYGAYVLRQEYPLQVIKATGISLMSVFIFIICLVFLGQNVPLSDNARSFGKKDKTHNLIPEPLLPKTQPVKAMEPAPAAPVAPTVATKAFRDIKIVSDLTPVAYNIPSQREFSQAGPNLETTAGDLPAAATPDIMGGTNTGNDTETGTDIPFEVVEKMPEFPDGQTAMYKFISKHLRYPAEAQSQGLEGNVILSFVVSVTGEISDVKILQDIGGRAGEEARRVVAKMPRWQPGLQHQRVVPVRFTLPIRFRIN